MPSYLSLFKYTAQALNDMSRAPRSRAEAVRAAVDEVGGTLESFYWMFGEQDGFMVFHVPDQEAAAAFAATVRGSGRLEAFVTHQIMDMDSAERALGMVTKLRRSYEPPGSNAAWRAEYDTIGASEE